MHSQTGNQIQLERERSQFSIESSSSRGNINSNMLKI
jgi:hypothetical protein